MTIEYTSDLTQGKTYNTSSVLSASYPAHYAFDNNVTTMWHSASQSEQWLSIDFTESVMIGKIRYYPEHTYSSTFKIQGSHDNNTWVDIFTGSAPTPKMYEFEFTNTTKYRYYRLYKNIGSYMGAYTLEMMGIVKSEYTPSGLYISKPIILVELPTNIKLNWLSDLPINTSILVEFSIAETIPINWESVNNGGVITLPADITGKYLWIKCSLTTTDTSVTPTLKSVWLEEPSAPQDKILLTMDWWGKFNNVEGDLTVNYDATKGNLTGAGGAVESFEVEFTPTDLVQTPNPHVVEYLKAYPYEINLDFKEIEYQNGYAEEHLKAYPYEIVLDLKHVSEINP